MAIPSGLDDQDQAEAEQGQILLEEKNKKRVRYWWEEGYVPGNEKDSDHESCASGSETKDTECEKQCEVNALPAEGEDSDYEEVEGTARGGRFVRWGGLHGRLCLADGHLALEDGEAAAPLQDYLDELLIPAPAPASEELHSSGAVDEASAETMAIVLYQTPESRIKPWSFCTITENMSASVDEAEVRKVFAIEDAKRNNRLYSEEMQALSQVAIGNYLLRQQQGMEVVQKAKEDEAIRRRNVTEGGKERLPGTKQPLAVSQAWQDHQGAAAPTPAPRVRKSMLPGSLTASSSSTSSSLRKEPLPAAKVPQHFDDADFDPQFRIPEVFLRPRGRPAPSRSDAT